MFGLDLSFLWTAFLVALPVIMGGGAVIGLLWYFSKHPESKFQIYVPLVIGAVRLAEKAIPDSSVGSLNKVDLFLKEFDRAYTEYTGKPLDEATKLWALKTKETVLVDLAKIGLTK